MGIVIALKDLFTTEANKIEQAYQKLDTGLAQAERSIERTVSRLRSSLLSAATVTGLLAGVFVPPAREAAEFEAALARVRAILDEGYDDLSVLRKELLEASKIFPTSPQEQAAALTEVVLAGITDVDRALAIMRLSNKAAVASMTSVEAAMDGIISMVHTYNLQLHEFDRLGDLMFKTVQRGRMYFDELSHALGNVAAPARVLGVQMEELFSTLAAITLGGIDVVRAGVAMRQMFLDLSRSTEQAEKLFESWGERFDAMRLKRDGMLKFFDDLRERVGLSGEALHSLLTSDQAIRIWEAEGDEGLLRFIEAAGIDTANLRHIFRSVQGLTAALILMAGANERWAEITEEMYNVGGEMDRAFNIVMSTFTSRMQIVIGNLRTILMLLGDPIIRAIKPFLNAFNIVLATIIDLLDRFVILRDIVMVLAFSIGLLTLAFITMRTAGLASQVMIYTINQALQALNIQAQVTGDNLRKALLIGMAPLAVITATLFLFRKDWEEDWAGIRSTVERFMEYMRLIRQALQMFFSTLQGDIGRIPMELAEQLEAVGLLDFTVTMIMALHRLRMFSKGFTDGFVQGWQDVRNVFEGIYNGIRPILQDLGRLFAWLAEKIGLVRFAPETVDAVERWGHAIGRVLGFLIGIIPVVLFWFTRLAVAFVTTKVKNFVTGIWESVKAVGRFGKALIGLVRNMAVVIANFIRLRWQMFLTGVQMAWQSARELIRAWTPALRAFLAGVQVAILRLRALATQFLLAGANAARQFGRYIMTTVVPALARAGAAVAAFIGRLVIMGAILLVNAVQSIKAMASSLLASLIPAVVSAASSVWAFTAALLANPITWVVGLIIVLGVALYYLIKNWDAVKEVVQGVWERLKEFAKNVWGIIAPILQPFVAVYEAIKTVLGALWTAFTTAFGTIWGFLGDWFKSLPGMIWNALMNLPTMIANVFQHVVTIIAGVWDWIKDIPARIAESIRNAFGGIGGWIKEQLAAFVGWLPDWITDRLGLTGKFDTSVATNVVDPIIESPEVQIKVPDLTDLIPDLGPIPVELAKTPELDPLFVKWGSAPEFEPIALEWDQIPTVDPLRVLFGETPDLEPVMVQFGEVPPVPSIPRLWTDSEPKADPEMAELMAAFRFGRSDDRTAAQERESFAVATATRDDMSKKIDELIEAVKALANRPVEGRVILDGRELHRSIVEFDDEDFERRYGRW